MFDARMTSHKDLIQATAFYNHHGRHFAVGVMADGFSTVFGHLFPGSVSLDGNTKRGKIEIKIFVAVAL